MLTQDWLLKEWNYEKNGDLMPSDVTDGSGKQVWWRCEKGHEWQAKISNRSQGQRCPYCTHRKVLAGFNDLATTNPKLASEWNYEKNGDLLPTDVLSGSVRKVWWRCDKGHEWQAAIIDRSKGKRCPYCSNQKVLAGFNDLATTEPEIVAEWDFEKNGELLPTGIVRGSTKNAWWRCEKGHSWQATPKNRSTAHSGCPFCANLKVLPGFNDLASQFPEIAAEWNYEKNGDLLPSQVVFGSNKRVWWKCEEGHEWEAMVEQRTRMDNTCPYCRKQKTLDKIKKQYGL